MYIRKNIICNVLLMMIYALLVACGQSSNSTHSPDNNEFFGEQGEVLYQVTLLSKWTSSSHVNGPEFPSNPHFSPPVSSLHDGSAPFWQRGANATAGLESLAETGDTTLIKAELSQDLGGGRLNYQTADSFSASGERGYTVSAKAGYTHLSIATMIAPSPDWFMGLSNMNLQDSEGRWHQKIVCDLVGYDAGTESADEFSTAGTPSDPIQTMHRLQDDSGAKTSQLKQPFAQISIELANLSDDIEMSTVNATLGDCVIRNSTTSLTLSSTTVAQNSSVRYTVSMQNLWTNLSHPNGPTFPAGAHFSAPVSAVHNTSTALWQRGATATSGLEALAETGSTSGFLNEINIKKTAGVLHSVVSSGFSAPSGSSHFTIEANSSHTYYTMASMIAPSPDWFIGLSTFNLQNAQGKWYQSIECELIGYDAGTEDADTFTLSGSARAVADNIHRLVDDEGMKTQQLIAPFAKITFTLNTADINNHLWTTNSTTVDCPN